MRRPFAPILTWFAQVVRDIFHSVFDFAVLAPFTQYACIRDFPQFRKHTGYKSYVYALATQSIDDYVSNHQIIFRSRLIAVIDENLADVFNIYPCTTIGKYHTHTVVQV